jgi:predicted aspartyl protease
MPHLPLIVIPDPDEPEAAEIYVDGAINERPYRFLLDTGAAATSVAADEYLADLETVGQQRSSGVFSAISNDLIQVSTLAIGSITRQNLIIGRLNAMDRGRGTLLGMDVLRHHRLHFRFNEAIVSVDDPVPTEHFSLQPIKFDSKFHAYIDVSFDGNDVQGVVASVVWDTGASLTVVNLDFAHQHPHCFAPDGSSTGTDASGTSVQTPMFIMSSARINGVMFPPHRVAAVDLGDVNRMIEKPMDMIMGYSTYRHADWLFDFPNAEWALTRTHFQR